jgi:hypothetical protein
MTRLEATIYAVCGVCAAAFAIPSSQVAPALPPAVSPSTVVAPTTPAAVPHDAVLDTPQPRVVSTPVAQSVPVQTVSWHEDYVEAYRDAAKQNKRLLVRFSAPWCGPCRNHELLDKDREVILRQFARLKVNVDQQSPAFNYQGAIPFEAVYEVSADGTKATPVWTCYPTSTPRYLERLREFGSRSVVRVRKAIRRVVATKTCANPLCRCVNCQCGPECSCGTAIGRPDNPACRCNPCLCGPNCACGMVPTQAPVTRSRCRGGRCR